MQNTEKPNQKPDSDGVDDSSMQTRDDLEDNHQAPRLDAKAQVVLGRQLKAFYNEIVHQPVPDEFMRLLDELARKETPSEEKER